MVVALRAVGGAGGRRGRRVEVVPDADADGRVDEDHGVVLDRVLSAPPVAGAMRRTAPEEEGGAARPVGVDGSGVVARGCGARGHARAVVDAARRARASAVARGAARPAGRGATTRGRAAPAERALEQAPGGGGGGGGVVDRLCAKDKQWVVGRALQRHVDLLEGHCAAWEGEALLCGRPSAGGRPRPRTGGGEVGDGEVRLAGVEELAVDIELDRLRRALLPAQSRAGASDLAAAHVDGVIRRRLVAGLRRRVPRAQRDAAAASGA